MSSPNAPLHRCDQDEASDGAGPCATCDEWDRLADIREQLVLDKQTRCPDCGGPTMEGEGVVVCTVCGWSKPND